MNSARIAAACNALSVAFFVSAFLQPLILGQSKLAFIGGALMAFIAFQGALHYVLSRVED